MRTRAHAPRLRAALLVSTANVPHRPRATAGEQPSIFVVNNYDAIVQALAEKVRSILRRG
jgi:hypothetical protein